MDTQVQSWRLFDPRGVWKHAGVTLLLWLGLLLAVNAALQQPGGLGKALMASEGQGRNGLAYTGIMAGGYTLVLLAMFLGRLSVVQVDGTGLQLLWAGRVQRQVFWASTVSCLPIFNARRQLVALTILDSAEQTRSFSLGLFAPAGPVADEILAAVRRHVPVAEPKPEPVVPTLSNRAAWRVAWILVAIIVGAFAYLLVELTRSR